MVNMQEFTFSIPTLGKKVGGKFLQGVLLHVKHIVS